MILLSYERVVDSIAVCVVGWIMEDLEGWGFWFLAQYALEDEDDTHADGDDDDNEDLVPKKPSKKLAYEDTHKDGIDDGYEDDENNDGIHSVSDNCIDTDGTFFQTRNKPS